MAGGALEGLRVLEWCGGTAGAFCGKLLSDLGAEVVKLEPPEGDRARRELVPVGKDTVGGKFLYLGTGKRSVVLDDSMTAGDRLRRLMSEADVILTDETADLDTSTTSPERAIWCSITPFGLSGPYAGWKGTHLTIFHAGGEGHLLPSGAGWELFPERPPLQLGSETGHYDTGANAAVAILAAVLRQRDNGQGERIDVSAQESQLTLNRTRLSRFNNDGIELRRDRSRYGVGGMLTCADGRVQLVGLRDEHWDRLATADEGAAVVRVAARYVHEGHDETAARSKALAEWCEWQPKRHVVALLADAGCPVGAYATPPDLVVDRQLVHRRFFQEVSVEGGQSVTLPGPPYQLSATPATLRAAPGLHQASGFLPRPDAVPSPATEPRDRPLSGVRVVDFTWAAAGPYATLLLAFLGAEVIKIETGRRLDPARRGFMADYGGVDRSPNFNELNLGKLGFQVNLTSPAGLDYVRRLIAISDVVVDNFRPGVMARYGLDAKSLLDEDPGLVVASSSANGSTGPDAEGAGLASIFGASGGLSEQTGYPDGPPTEVGESTDYRSANALAIAILAALVHRQRTGEGQFIDLSSREVVVATSPHALLGHLLGIDDDLRIGNRHHSMCPHDVYLCQGEDQWIAIAVDTETEWADLCALLGRPDWPTTYPSATARSAARAVIDAAVAAWTRALPSTDAFRLLQRHGIAAAPSWTNQELAADPHLAARRVFVAVDHPLIGTQRVMRAPWLFAATDCSVRRHGPLLGQDNRLIVEDVLGANMPSDEDVGNVFQ
jgi:crotonobetainyl-CoA:carnitine CoA-transferase CaiB-like acyl-CoA transferase